MTHTCERCGKQFTQNKYKKHLQRKRPCKKISPPQNIKLQILPKKKHPPPENTHTQTNTIFNFDGPYADEIVTKQGDCLEIMKNIPNDSIDLILCDLPYGVTKCKWDSPIDVDKLWEQYKRIIKKPQGVIALFAQQPFTSLIISKCFKLHKYNLFWKKNRVTQFLLANYRPMKCIEEICIFSYGGAAAASRKTGNMVYNPQGLIPKIVKKRNSKKRIGKMLDQLHHLGPNNKLISNTEYEQKFTNYPKELIEFPIVSKKEATCHETQKPVKLLEYLIKTYSNENNIVLDNAMGSGSTGIACLNTNRKFIGIEIETKYYQIAHKRIMHHVETI